MILELRVIRSIFDLIYICKYYYIYIYHIYIIYISYIYIYIYISYYIYNASPLESIGSLSLDHRFSSGAQERHRGKLRAPGYEDFHQPVITALDDGKILTGKPDQFDGKNRWFPVKIFPTKPIH